MGRPVELTGRFYLVVEDEYLVADNFVMILENAMARVAGPASSIDNAIKLIRECVSELDGAILDVNLRGLAVYPVAEMLSQNQVPFVFVTGYECASIPAPFRAAPCLNKPCDEQDLLKALADLPPRGCLPDRSAHDPQSTTPSG